MDRPLTPLDVRRLGPGRYQDAEVRGLYLRVTPTGGRSFILRYQLDKRRRDMHLGSVRQLTLADAREQARACWTLVQQGRDPIEARRLLRQDAKQGDEKIAWTVERAAHEKHRTLAPSWKNDKHAAQWINTMRDYVFPLIGSMPVGAVDVAAVLLVLRPIWTTKAETARRVRQRLAAVIDWAIAHGYATTNPVGPAVSVLPKQRDQVKHHKAMSRDHAPGFFAELSGGEPWPARLALQYLILTCTRSIETRGARWSEIDRKALLWTVPGERMKSKRPHAVPLSAEAIAVLDLAAHVFYNNEPQPTDLVFPSMNGKMLSDNAFGELLERMGVDDATAHGFRSTFRDWAAEQGIDREVAERVLAHVVGDETEAAYYRTTLLERRRDVMQQWAKFIA
jgi:integrase